MGYLELPSGPDNFAKAVISLWFRIPAATVLAAQAQWTSEGVDAFYTAIHDDPGAIIPTFDNNLLGVIPLVTWGPNPLAQSLQFGNTSIGPCFIGLNCGPAFIDPPSTLPTTPILAFGFSYSDQDTVSSTNTVPNFFEVGRSTSGFWEGNSFNSIPDDSVLMHAAPDRWHHLLVSFDLDHGDPDVSADPCKLWVALDDVNRNGLSFWPAYAGPPGNSLGDLNSIAQNSMGFGKANGALQSSTHPFGVPTTGDNVDWVYNIEMADLQVYAGISLDTSLEANRRMFVTSIGKPENSSVAIAELGKRPEVMLHGQDDWIAGINTGTVANFAPTGTITPFTPDPGL